MMLPRGRSGKCLVFFRRARKKLKSIERFVVKD